MLLLHASDTRSPRRPSRQARARSAHELGGRAVDVAVDDGEAVIAGNGAQPPAARWGSSAVFDTTMAGTVVTVLSFGLSCDRERHPACGDNHSRPGIMSAVAVALSSQT